MLNWDIVHFLKDYWFVFAGLVLLYFYGRHHFNTPDYVLSVVKERSEADDDRGSVKRSRLAQLRTTAPPMFTIPRNRYRKFARCYVLGLWGVFLLIIFAPEAAQHLPGLSFTEGAMEEGGRQTLAVWALLALTGLLPSLPGLREWDTQVLRFLHQRAAIPDDVRATASQLFNAEFHPAEKDAAKVKDELDSRFFREDEPAAFAGVLETDWFRVACLWRAIRNLINERQYRLFQCRFEEDFDETDEIYKHQHRQLEEYKELEAQMVPGGTADIDRFLKDRDDDRFDQLKERRRKLRYKVDSLLYRLCILSSLLVYATELKIDKIDSRFKKLGFDVRVKPLPRFDTDTALKTSIVLFAALIATSVIYGVVAPSFVLGTSGGNPWIPKNGLAAFSWAVAGVLLHGFAVMIAIVMKRYFARRRVERPGDPREGRFSRNMLIAVCALAVAGAMLFAMIAPMGEQIKWEILAWSLVSAVTAYFVAVYIDSVVDDKPVGGALVVAHVGTMVAATLVAVIVVMVKDFNELRPIVYGFSVYACLTSAIIGLCVATVFPRAYRKGFGHGFAAAESAQQERLPGGATPGLDQTKSPG